MILPKSVHREEKKNQTIFILETTNSLTEIHEAVFPNKVPTI